MRPSDETGFTYDANNDWNTCTQGIHLIFKRTEQNDKKANISKRVYQSSIKDCKNCPFRDTCVNARGFKKIAHSIDKPYDTMQQKMKTDEARRLMRLRSSTVEPVIGSLVNYTGIKRINTKGIKQANKCLIMQP